MRSIQATLEFLASDMKQVSHTSYSLVTVCHPGTCVHISEGGIALVSKLKSSPNKLIASVESGGLRLKRDITEYGEFVRSFNAPTVDEKFELLGIMANVFIVAPESLSTLFEGTPSIRKDAQRFIQLRDDYKSAKLAARLSSLWASSS